MSKDCKTITSSIIVNLFSLAKSTTGYLFCKFNNSQCICSRNSSSSLINKRVTIHQLSLDVSVGKIVEVLLAYCWYNIGRGNGYLAVHRESVKGFYLL